MINTSGKSSFLQLTQGVDISVTLKSHRKQGRVIELLGANLYYGYLLYLNGS